MIRKLDEPALTKAAAVAISRRPVTGQAASESVTVTVFAAVSFGKKHLPD